MRVLVACEYSGTVREAFAAKGHDAWSCDLLPTDIPGSHIQGNVLDVIKENWDLMIAHPPCTYLAKAGLHYEKTRPGRSELRVEAVNFVIALYNAPIPKICIENPPGWLNTHWKKPTQTIEPYYFGDPHIKQTSLWLRGLPRLQGLVSVASNKKSHHPKPIWEASQNRPGETYRRKYYFTSSVKDPLLKAKTFPGIAKAMADQWG